MIQLEAPQKMIFLYVRTKKLPQKPRNNSDAFCSSFTFSCFLFYQRIRQPRYNLRTVSAQEQDCD